MVDKYAGKTAAIVGWEIDQVRRTPEGGEVSVPISASYNHHFSAQMVGGASRFKKVKLSGPDDPRVPELLHYAHGGQLDYDQEYYIVEAADGSGSQGAYYPMDMGNGGEYRKTFHGLPPGYALLVDSPTQFHDMPMQIDTWNRDEMNISGPLPPKFVPGPLPRANQAPADATYSGLLECPLTTRITRVVDGLSVVQSKDTCASDLVITTAEQCFQEAKTQLNSGSGKSFVNTAGSDATQPTGCSLTTDTTNPLVYHVFYNNLTTSSISCAAGATTFIGATDSLVNVQVSLDLTKQLATLSFTGPADVWFGVAFGAEVMADRPWAVVVDGKKITDREQERNIYIYTPRA